MIGRTVFLDVDLIERVAPGAIAAAEASADGRDWKEEERDGYVAGHIGGALQVMLSRCPGCGVMLGSRCPGCGEGDDVAF